MKKGEKFFGYLALGNHKNKSVAKKAKWISMDGCSFFPGSDRVSMKSWIYKRSWKLLLTTKLTRAKSLLKKGFETLENTYISRQRTWKHSVAPKMRIHATKVFLARQSENCEIVLDSLSCRMLVTWKLRRKGERMKARINHLLSCWFII